MFATRLNSTLAAAPRKPEGQDAVSYLVNHVNPELVASSDPHNSSRPDCIYQIAQNLPGISARIDYSDVAQSKCTRTCGPRQTARHPAHSSVNSGRHNTADPNSDRVPAATPFQPWILHIKSLGNAATQTMHAPVK